MLNIQHGAQFVEKIRYMFCHSPHGFQSTHGGVWNDLLIQFPFLEPSGSNSVYLLGVHQSRLHVHIRKSQLVNSLGENPCGNIQLYYCGRFPLGSKLDRTLMETKETWEFLEEVSGPKKKNSTNSKAFNLSGNKVIAYHQFTYTIAQLWAVRWWAERGLNSFMMGWVFDQISGMSIQ